MSDLENINLLHSFAMSIEPISGSRTYLLNLVKAQEYYANVNILCRYDKNNSSTTANIIPIRMYKFDSWQWLNKNEAAARRAIALIKNTTSSFLKENKIDIVNIHHITYSLNSAYIAKHEFNIPTVLTSHGTGIYQNKEDTVLMGYLRDNVDKVIAVSNFLKRYIVQNSEVKNKNIVTIYPGVDCTIFNRKNYSRDLIKKYGNYILFFGRIEKEKGISMIIEMAKRIPKEIKFLVIGKGKDMVDFTRQIKRNNLQNKIICMGYLDLLTLAKFVASSIAVIVPSEFNDPFPLVPLEAIVSGTPIIVSKNGGLRELPNLKGIIKVNSDAEEFSDALTKLIDIEDSIRDELFKKASSKYSWSSVAKQYLKLYSKILARD